MRFPIASPVVCLAFLLSGTVRAGTARAAGPDTRPVPPAAAPLRPFTVFTWDFAGIGRQHLRPLYWVGRGTAPAFAGITTSRMPAGERALITTDFGQKILEHPGDVCVKPDGTPTKVQGIWPDRGVRAASEQFDAFLETFSKAGGQVDLLVLDQEGGYSNWVMNEERLAAIGADPRYPAVAERTGLPDARAALFERRTERKEYLRWNAVMDEVVNQAIDRAMFEPLRRHFPRAGMSNFGAVAMPQWDVVPDGNGHYQYTLGEPAGTFQSPAFYGGAAPATVIQANWDRPFIQLLYAANGARAAARASRRPIVPWFGFKNFVQAAPGRLTYLGNTRYWEEVVYHSMLAGGSTNALFWNPRPNGPSPVLNPPPNSALPQDNDAMEAAMAELSARAGGRPFAGPATVEPVAYDVTFLATAAILADGSTLVRVTFGDKGTEAAFEVAGKPVKVARPKDEIGVWVRVPK